MSTNGERRVVLAAGVRVPQVRAGGVFGKEDAGHLGGRVGRELLARTGIDPAEIDETLVGCVGPPHDQSNVGRVISLRAGVPEAVPAYTICRNCASGMEAVTTAATRIEAGRGELFLCIGVEVMSAYPLIYNRSALAFFTRMMKARSVGQKLSALMSLRPPMFFAPRIAITEGLTDPVSGLIMGSTAENLARDFAITREAADAYALQSHERAKIARDAGRLAREIVPHLPQGAKRGAPSIEHDDGIRDDQTPAALAKLKPYFEKPDGVVTVGNACGITDGATALIVTSEKKARELGLTPLAAIKSFAWAGLDPARMGLGPVYATAKALDEAGVTLADIGAIELNEAFAVQVLACIEAFGSDEFARRELGRDGALGEFDPARINENGGAIALGHPVGATAARLLLTAAHQLEVGDHEFTLATLCIGGGQGGAVILERLSS